MMPETGTDLFCVVNTTLCIQQHLATQTIIDSRARSDAQHLALRDTDAYPSQTLSGIAPPANMYLYLHI